MDRANTNELAEARDRAVSLLESERSLRVAAEAERDALRDSKSRRLTPLRVAVGLLSWLSRIR
jgi:hypothetical protein